MKRYHRKRTGVEGASSPAKTPNATYDVVIERILPGGVGLAHSEGLTLMVGLAVPGDRVRVRIDRVQGRLAFASITEVLEPSADRVEPPCPYFGRCGGCDFQQLNYEAQLAAKVDIIRDCLHRIAKVDFIGEIPITPSPSIWHYRSRAQWQHDPQEMRLGYFERGSHRVCDVASCAVLVPELESTLESLRVAMKNGELAELAWELQAAAGDDGVSLLPAIGQLSARDISRVIAGHRYYFNAKGFFQVNHTLLDQLLAAAIGGAQGNTAVDLYCGAGLFTLPLAQRFMKVIGVEADAVAIKYASRNLADAGLENAKLENSKVGDWLSQNRELAGSIDLLVLDPPRTGAEHGAIEDILTLRPRHIVYVSCDPATLARDLKELIGGGYSLDSLAAFDMFPQTHHVETVALLTRDNR